MNIYQQIFNIYEKIRCISYILFSTLFLSGFLLPFTIIKSIFVYTDIWATITRITFYLYNRSQYVLLPNSSTLIDKGFILPNHRSWYDFFYDPYITKSTIVGRMASILGSLNYGLIGMIEKRFILIKRSSSRQESFKKVINYINNGKRYYNKRILFFPEGTRKRHTEINSIEEAKLHLKPGMLKSIYEYNELPVQLFISKNKEKCLDEKNLRININTTIYSSLSKPIYPKNYSTFDDFYTAITTEWYKQWNYVYNYKND